MSLHATVDVRVGSAHIDVAFDAPARAVTALVGPNGAGKTTVLRSIAGTLALDAGRVTLSDEVLSRPPDVHVPPERRDIGVVFQDHVLFPHLSARDNVAFGPRCHGSSRAEARMRSDAMLELVGLRPFADAKPRTLSGGQAQLVAVARALATDPKALLLDEPLAALDAGARIAVRRDLRRFLGDFAGPVVLVTHDAIDAFVLADTVVVIEQGRVTQAGTVAAIAAQPASRYVADLLGTNLVRGRAEGITVTTESGGTLITAEPHTGNVLATIAPSAVALHRDAPADTSARNHWSTTVSHVEPAGERVRVQLTDPLPLVAEITAAAATELRLHPGVTVWASVKATEIVTYAV